MGYLCICEELCWLIILLLHLTTITMILMVLMELSHSSETKYLPGGIAFVIVTRI